MTKLSTSSIVCKSVLVSNIVMNPKNSVKKAPIWESVNVFHLKKLLNPPELEELDLAHALNNSQWILYRRSPFPTQQNWPSMNSPLSVSENVINRQFVVWTCFTQMPRPYHPMTAFIILSYLWNTSPDSLIVCFFAEFLGFITLSSFASHLLPKSTPFYFYVNGTCWMYSYLLWKF